MRPEPALKGPAGVLALVLAETVAGGIWLLFCSPLWNEVRRGFFKLTGIVLALLALSSWGAIAAARRPLSTAGAWSWWLALAVLAATLVWVVLLYVRLERTARVIGFLTVPLSVAWLFALAGTADRGQAVAFFQLLAGAAFMGAVMDGLLLGHWYLTDRRLTRKPINRFTVALLVAVVLEAIAVLASGFGGSGTSRALSPLFTAAGVASYVAIGMVAATGLIAVMIRATLKGERPSAVQAATGFFYLAVITGFTAELAAKIRFLP